MTVTPDTSSPATGSRRRPTPSLLLGPYYPVDAPGDGGEDLWHTDALHAGVRRLTLSGRVEAMDGTPVVDARVELWHADQEGRYRHPSAGSAAAPDPAFIGYGSTRTDAHGDFVFRSLVPGAYIEGATRRAPHLHLQVTGRWDRLVTQGFLPGGGQPIEDRWFAAIERRDLLIPEIVQDDPDHLALRWTLVVRNG